MEQLEQVTIVTEQIKEIVIIALPVMSALAGVWLASYLRDKSRKRDFAADTVMQKKIATYEAFYKLMRHVYDNSMELFKAAEKQNTAKIKALNDKQFQDCMKLMSFCDDNALYLDEDVVLHVGAMCMIPAELNDMDVEDKDYVNEVGLLTAAFADDYGVAVELVKEYMGIKRLEKSFKKINNPKVESATLNYAKKLRKEYETLASSNKSS